MAYGGILSIHQIAFWWLATLVQLATSSTRKAGLRENLAADGLAKAELLEMEGAASKHSQLDVQLRFNFGDTR